MKTLRLNFTIPEDVNKQLRELVAPRKRSRFVSEAVREKLQKIEEEKFNQELIRGYIERREEDIALNKEWEAATLENWPE